MTETLTIRVASTADLAAVDALLARAYPRLLRPHYPASVMVTIVPILARARPELLASGTYFLAEDASGRLLGAGGWTRRRHPGEADIRHVVTDHRATRRGVGRAIMSRVLHTAAAGGVRHLDCLSTLMAVPFYMALGFDVQGRVDVPVAPPITFATTRMTRIL